MYVYGWPCEVQHTYMLCVIKSGQSYLPPWPLSFSVEKCDHGEESHSKMQTFQIASSCCSKYKCLSIVTLGRNFTE